MSHFAPALPLPHASSTDTVPVSELPVIFTEVLSLVADYAKSAGFPAGWCVPAAAVVQNLLEHVGVCGSRLIAVDCAALAHEWAEPVGFARGMAVGDVPVIQSSVGSDEIVEGRWGGHVVVYVPSAAGGGQPWVLDPTAGQFDIAERDLGVTPYVAQVSRGLLGGEVMMLPTRTGRGVLRVERKGTLRNHQTLLTEYVEFIETLTDILLSGVPAAA